MNLGACSALTTSPLTGVWYRALPLQRLNTALQTSQTRFIPGRFNDGTGLFDVLYLCENPFVAFMEVGATFGSLTNVIPNPAVPWAIFNVRVRLHAISDLAANVASLQTSAQELTGDWREYSGPKVRRVDGWNRGDLAPNSPSRQRSVLRARDGRLPDVFGQSADLSMPGGFPE